MSRIALAAYSPHRAADVLGCLTAWWTDRDPARRTPPERAWVSHVEVVIDGVCHSASLRDGGVRAKRIDLDKFWWRIIPIEWRDPEAALRAYRAWEGEPYGWGDLIAQHVLRLPIDWRGPTCSELAAHMLGLPRAERLDPAWITDYCESRRAAS